MAQKKIPARQCIGCMTSRPKKELVRVVRAPHGGIFVFPVVDHTLLYCVALAAGSVVGAVILSLLKKDRTDAA